MPYYHIRLKKIRGRPSIVYEFDVSKKNLEALLKRTKKERQMFLSSSFEWIEEKDIEDIDIAQTSRKSSYYGIGRLKGKRIFERGKIVTSQFIKKPLSRKVEKQKVFPSAKPAQKILSKNVFIVHGRDTKSLNEIKTILMEFGLNPIVLHEKPSGSRTIVEKLEKYSDVGYAFIILTPDDLSCSAELLSEQRELAQRALDKQDSIRYPVFMKDLSEGDLVSTSFLRPRARQNVILEFGYFIGKLERDRVCCLHKGKVELPSDMQGIVYIPFEESVNEVRDKIIKELKEAGYEIRL